MKQLNDLTSQCSIDENGGHFIPEDDGLFDPQISNEIELKQIEKRVKTLIKYIEMKSIINDPERTNENPSHYNENGLIDITTFTTKDIILTSLDEWKTHGQGNKEVFGLGDKIDKALHGLQLDEEIGSATANMLLKEFNQEMSTIPWQTKSESEIDNCSQQTAMIPPGGKLYDSSYELETLPQEISEKDVNHAVPTTPCQISRTTKNQTENCWRQTTSSTLDREVQNSLIELETPPQEKESVCSFEEISTANIELGINADATTKLPLTRQIQRLIELYGIWNDVGGLFLPEIMIIIAMNCYIFLHDDTKSISKAARVRGRLLCMFKKTLIFFGKIFVKANRPLRRKNQIYLLKVFFVLVLQISAGFARDKCNEAVESVEFVKSCPKTKKEWQQREQMKNCTAISQMCSHFDKFKYHCVPNTWRNATMEVCAPTWYINGYCVEFNIRGGIIQNMLSLRCRRFRMPCPKKYISTDIYKYQECYGFKEDTGQLDIAHSFPKRISANTTSKHDNFKELILNAKDRYDLNNSSSDGKSNIATLPKESDQRNLFVSLIWTLAGYFCVAPVFFCVYYICRRKEVPLADKEESTSLCVSTNSENAENEISKDH